MRATIFVVALLIAGVAALPAPALAQTPTVKATPSATVGAPPVAPSNVRILGDRITWADNSTDEDGFRIRYSIGAPEDFVLYTTGPNAVSFQLPADAPRVSGCAANTATASVAAFNQAGESSSGDVHLTLECPVQVATPTSAKLPNTGRSAAVRDGTGPASAAGIVALVSVGLLSCAFAIRARRKSERW